MKVPNWLRIILLIILVLIALYGIYTIIWEILFLIMPWDNPSDVIILSTQNLLIGILIAIFFTILACFGIKKLWKKKK